MADLCLMVPLVLVVVLATLEGCCCSLPPAAIQTARVGAGLGDALVEALSPFDRSSLKLRRSVRLWS